MKKISHLLFIFFALFLVLLSCDKKDDAGPSNELLLSGNTSKEWKITGIKGSSSDPSLSNITVDIYNNKVSGIPLSPAQLGLPTFPECAKDDVIIFKSDKTYVTNEGSNICSGSVPFQVSSGKWEFTDGGKKLVLKDESGQEFIYDITKLTETVLEGETSASMSYQGTNITAKIATTFTAQ